MPREDPADTPKKKPKAGKADGMEAREHQGQAKRSIMVSSRKRRRNRGACPSISLFRKTAEKPVQAKAKGNGPYKF